MANKKTVALTNKQYEEIIKMMDQGGCGFRPNEQIKTILVLEANLGLRINDIIDLRLCDIIKDGNRYRLDMKEGKTKKKRVFTVPTKIYDYISKYAFANGIANDEKIFKISERAVQIYLKKVVDYLGMTNIGTHSFRKYFATEMYVNNNYDIVLVQTLLQHSSPTVTQRYISISSQQIEEALSKHIRLL